MYNYMHVSLINIIIITICATFIHTYEHA